MREGNEEEPEDDELTDKIDNIDPLAFAEFTSLNGWGEFSLDNFTVMEKIIISAKITEGDLNVHLAICINKVRSNSRYRRFRKPHVIY